jgi:DNA-binding response OmpR family regulator
MSKQTILVVEDEQVLNDAYVTILKKEGFKVLSAFDGEEALSVAETNDIDLMLLDLRMPKVNGIEFLKAYDLKSQKKPPIVIVFSNLDMQEEIDEAFELGATKYMLKAWASPKELVKLVKDNLASKK